MSNATPPTVGVRVIAPDGAADYRLSLADIEVTIGEVFDALGLPSTGTAVDGSVPATPDVRAIELLRSGSCLSVGPARLPAADANEGPALVEVAHAGGLDAGSVAQLPKGRYRVGGSGHPGQGWYLAIDHPLLAATQGRPWHEHGQTIEAVNCQGAVLSLGRPIDAEAGHPGYLHRPPRRMPPDDVAVISVAKAPDEVKQPAPLSWATLLAPIPIALLMAFFFRPLFAVFAAMGPIVALGRWFEGKRRFKRDTAKRNAAVAEMKATLAYEVSEQAEALARLRWLTNPHVPELWRRARVRSVRLWERRPESLGYGVVTVGIGPDATEPRTDDGRLDDEVHELLRSPLALRPVPHVVDLAQHSGLGIYGDRTSALAVARSVVMQLASLHGPADVRIGLLGESSADEWDWLKWLPHLDERLVAEHAAPIVKELTPRPGDGRMSVPTFGNKDEIGAIDVVIVDDSAADVAALHRAAKAAGRQVRFVAIAEHPTLLPAACTSLAEVGPNTVEIATPHLTGSRVTVAPVGISRETAVAWARALAPVQDPEVTEFAGGGDAAVSLLQLVNFRSEGDLAERWAARPPDASPTAAVGVGDAGPFMVDIDHDGPHALVAGTTGSGKSEFLRTLVVALATECPPEQLNFVLVDFKGGGAFDICDRLPHIAGLITDLDEAMVVRAINSLRAELHRREHLFRSLGVSAYHEAVRVSPEPIARLLIVVDEFAALATDYADLMASIIDLAARGRSLGMHLVLATQRPSGVVDQKIRANTNLRVALRVQDAFDSQDVIGVADAAAIDRNSPGRAIFSIGGDTPVTVQTAYSGAPDVRARRCTVDRLDLFEAGECDLLPRPATDAEAVAEIDVLIEAIEAVSASRNYTPRPLWPDPLPTTLDWIDLGTRVLSAGDLAHDAGDLSPTGLALGLADLPDMQAQLPWRWDPDSGPLVIYGSSAPCAGKALVSIGAALAAEAGPSDVHLYLLDGDAGNISPLTGLPHTGAYVTASEADRLERTVVFFERALAERRAGGDTSARLVLLVDNLAAVLGNYDELSSASFIDRISALARDGAQQRIHLALTARTVRDVSHRLAQQIPNRLVMNLADPNSYLTIGLKQKDVVPLPEMRAMDLGTLRVIQLVEPPDLADHGVMASAPTDRMPAPIRAFPTELAFDDLAPASVGTGGELLIPVGVEAGQLDPAVLVLQPGEHALVVAPPGAGRSTAVGMIAAQLDRSPVGLDLYRLAPPGSPIARDDAPGTLIHDAEALSELGDRAGVLVVDDVGRLADDLGAALETLTTAGASSLRVIAAASPDVARAMRSPVAKIRAGGTGLMIGGAPTDGDLLKVKLTKLAGLGSIAGRGHVVVRGRVLPAQFASAPAEATAPSQNR